LFPGVNEMHVGPSQELNHGRRIIRRVRIQVKRKKRDLWSTLSKAVHVNRKRFGTESNLITGSAGWARRERVDLVHLVYLVCLVQPNKRDRPDKQERPVCPRASRFDRLTVLSHVEGRATVCGAGALLPHLAKARGKDRKREVVSVAGPACAASKKTTLIALQQWSPDNA
jgi:hypothetical protein